MAYNRVPGIDENYKFPPQVLQATASSAEMTATIQNNINDKVPGVVADVIAEDSTIIEAAESAVNGVLGDRLTDIEEVVYENPIQFLNIEDPTYSTIRLSRDYRVLGGELRDGGTLGVFPNTIDSVLSAGDGRVDLTFDYRRAEPGADSTGVTPQHVLDEWASRMQGSTGVSALISVGDSMTMDYQSQGVSVAEKLAENLGLNAYNRGYSGETPLQIAWRMGVAEVRAIVTDGVIPSSGSKSVVLTPADGWFRGRSFECYVMDINGVNRHVRITQENMANPDLTPTWTISVLDSLGSARILDGTRVTPITGVDPTSLANPMVLWTGRNDPNLDRVIKYTNLFLENHRDPLRRIMVRPVFNNATESEGTSGYDNIMAINAALADLCGPNFYDDRSALIKYGLEIEGITPTANDLDAIAVDNIPPSLKLDTTHLNAAGRRALSRIDAIELKNRNWFI